MLFGRKNRRNNVPPHVRTQTNFDPGEPEFYPIEFDMLLKGAIFQRKGKQIRQIGVTVNGSTRLITSGDVVDRQTYKALVDTGAIRPLPRDRRGVETESTREPEQASVDQPPTE